jgi:hypothetical protein
MTRLTRSGQTDCLRELSALSSNNAWLIVKKSDRLNLYYILVRVGEVRNQDRFFIVPQLEMNS